MKTYYQASLLGEIEILLSHAALDPTGWEGIDTQLRNVNSYKESDQDGAILRWAKG